MRLPRNHTRFWILVPALLLTWLVSAQSSLQVGYAVFTADAGSRLPVGSALFTVTNRDGILVSQAGVGAVEPFRRGRLFVDEAGPQTGVALVNNSSNAAAVTLVLRNSAGVEIVRNTQTLPAGSHLSRFVNQLFPDQAAGLRGSLTFESDLPLAPVTLRQSRNAYGESLYSTLPVVDLSAPSSTDSVVFPHIACGGGYTTELLLMNTGVDSIRGQVRLYKSDGQALQAFSDGQSITQLAYDIPANGTFRAQLDAPALTVGWATVIPAPGSGAPAGSVVFRFGSNNAVMTEAGVAPARTTASARIFVDNAGTRTGIALANPSTTSAEVTFRLLDRNGRVEDTASRPLGGGQHLPVFVNDLFSSMIEGFTGVLEIQSPVPIASVALKVTTNARGDLVLTTFPVADPSRTSTPSAASSLVFPQIAIGGEFSTRLIFINPHTDAELNGRVSFFQSNGATMVTALGGDLGSQFPYRVSSGGGRQLLPGNTARVSTIALVDISSNSETSELVVNEGNTIRPRLRVIDSTGQVRDDFDVSYAASNRDVATVNADASISGNRSGFSTLTLSAGGAILLRTITVVRVEAGASGLNTGGIVQDFAQRLYLASQDHTILLAQNLSQPPARYAGTDRSPGLRDDLRLLSQFNSPAFLALNQSEGSLYVTDSANHAIRRVRPGGNGRVQLLTGTGSPGSRDGALAQAQFNSPQGIALDSRGNLWISDTGNHSIHRISLATGRVETIAGTAGVAGLADGSGAAARFRSPVGIAVDTESALEQLDRERRGLAQKPVSVIVADSGNGVLRRVSETGAVETIAAQGFLSAIAASRFGRSAAQPPPGPPLTFDSPSGVLVDAFDNIYVSEPASGRVRVLLSSGEVVTAVQGNTFRTPKGLTTTLGGSLVVADTAAGAQQLSYGAPRIASINPPQISDSGGAPVTIRGSNFAPDSVVVIGDVVVPNAVIQNTETITFTAPPAGSGRSTVTVQNRGGLGQAALLVEPQAVSVLPAGYITTFAGGTTYAGDGGAAAAARFNEPVDVAVDPSGAVYVVDERNHRIRKIDPRTGIINTVAGSGQEGSGGDSGPATAAQLHTPSAIDIDGAGNIFIADFLNGRIRKVDAATGIITTVAGTTAFLDSGDGGPATAAGINLPQGVAVDSAGNIYISQNNTKIRKIDAATGIITTIAGTGRSGFSGDGGPATAAQLGYPLGVAVDSSGNVYVTDLNNYRIRRIEAATGRISTVAGIGYGEDYGVDDIPATSTILDYPRDVSVDASGNLYIADYYGVRKVDAVTGIITRVAGGGSTRPSSSESVPASSADIVAWSATTDAGGNLFIADNIAQQLHRVSANSGRLSVYAGLGLGPVGDGKPATFALLNDPAGIAFDTLGNLLIADSWNQRLRRIDARTGLISTIAGDGVISSRIDLGDNGPATSARLSFPKDIAVDPAGNIYFSQFERIRKISSTTGIITTIATTEGGTAQGIAVDYAGNVFTSVGVRVFRIPVTGEITVIAGGGSPASGNGDGGLATSAKLSYPRGLAFDAAGDLYIADGLISGGGIRKVALATGIITAYAAPPVFGGFGNDTPASLAFDSRGNLFALGNVLNRISSEGIVRFIAGVAFQNAFWGDNGPATRAIFNFANDVAVDSRGNIFIADSRNNRIRIIRGPLP